MSNCFMFERRRIQHARKDRVQSLSAAGLCDVVVRAQFHGANDGLRLCHAGEHDDPHGRVYRAELSQTFQPVHAWHIHVKQHEVGAVAALKTKQRIMPASRGFDRIGLHFEHTAKIREYLRLGATVRADGFVGRTHNWKILSA